MSSLKRPYDSHTATQVMKKFSDLAYSLVFIETFQEAVNILYGKDFIIKTDMSKRMQFSCQICNRDMNSENAMAEHYRSGSHQKNLDKKSREGGEPSFNARASQYPPDSLHYRLLNSKIKPIGLQMVEEYDNGRGSTYYKCNICGAHGNLDTMYHHLIGKKHTEKYIKSACVLESSLLTSNEREEIRAWLSKNEKINVQSIKTIRGRQYYPKKWEAEGRNYSRINMMMIKKERSPSPCDSPGPSKSYRSRSSSGYKSMRRSRSPSSKSSRRSISPYRSSNRQSVKRDTSPLSHYRNKSPSPVKETKKIKIGSPSRSLEKSMLSQVLPLPSGPPPPQSSVLGVEPQPVPPPQPIPPPKEKHDKTCQISDMEELMTQLNFIVKTHDLSDSDIKTPADAKLAIEMMFRLTQALLIANNTLLENSSYKSESKYAKLCNQKEVLQKIQAYVRHRLEAAWKVKHRFDPSQNMPI